MQKLFSISAAIMAGYARAFVVSTVPARNTFLQQQQPARAALSTVAASSPTRSPQMKIAIVTGGSKGLGAAIAKDLAGAGCSVIVNYASSSGPAEEVVEEIKGKGGKATAVKANVADPEEVNSLFEAATEAFPDEQIEILVNNAGIIRDKPTLEMKIEEWQQVIDINLSSVFYCSQAASKLMLKQRKGRIVNISSMVALIGSADQANYAAAKAGVLGMTKVHAKEYAPEGVTVNAVCPGYIESDMTAHHDQEELNRMIPLGRLGKPEEIAAMVKYLATEEAASYITGQHFTVDGGLATGT